MGLRFTEQMSQALSWPVADLPPLNRASNTNANATGWVVGPIDMLQFRRAIARLSAGVFAGAPLAANIAFLAGTSNLTNMALAVAGIANATQFVAVSGGPVAAISGNSNSAMIEMRSDQMPTGTRWLAAVINNQSALVFQAEIFGGCCVYDPANQNNNTVVLNSQVY